MTILRVWGEDPGEADFSQFLGSPAGGDLSGTYPSPLVRGLLDRPLGPGTPVSGNSLVFNGSEWVPGFAPAGPPTGLAAGDLSGAYPSPTVAAIRGILVDSATPPIGARLQYNGAQWVGSPPTVAGPASGDLGGNYPSPSVVRLQGHPVSTSTPLLGQHLIYNGTDWEPAPVVPGTIEVPVTNNTGSLIARGSVLTIEVASSTSYDVDLLPNSAPQRMKVIGIAKADLPDAATGFAIPLGLVSVLIAGGSAINRGDFVRAAPLGGIADGVAGQVSTDQEGIFGLILQDTADPGGGSTALVPCHVGLSTTR